MKKKILEVSDNVTSLIVVINNEKYKPNGHDNIRITK